MGGSLGLEVASEKNLRGREVHTGFDRQIRKRADVRAKCACVCLIYLRSAHAASMCITVLAAGTDGQSFPAHRLFSGPSTPWTRSDGVW